MRAKERTWPETMAQFCALRISEMTSPATFGSARKTIGRRVEQAAESSSVERGPKASTTEPSTGPMKIPSSADTVPLPVPTPPGE